MKILVTQELELGFELPRELDEEELRKLEEHINSYSDHCSLEYVQELIEEFLEQEIFLVDGGRGNLYITEYL